MSVTWRNIVKLFRGNRLFLTQSHTMQADKNSNNKRPLEDKNESTAKKPATRQASLLSMFKPKVVVEKDVQALGVKTSTRKPIDLFPDMDDAMKELLDLELTTMQYDWFKALKPEFTKPYFIQVSIFLLQGTHVLTWLGYHSSKSSSKLKKKPKRPSFLQVHERGNRCIDMKTNE